MTQPAKKAPSEPTLPPPDTIPEEVHEKAAALAKRLLSPNTDEQDD